jgi:anti-sigma factor RsiW
VKPRDEELMAWVDGELPRDEARQLERGMEGEAAEATEAKAKVRAMQQVGEVIKARYEAAADEAQPRLDALWARLERQLDEAPAKERAVAEQRGFFAAVREWFDSYRGHVLTGAVCAAAAALAVIIARPDRVVERETVRVVEVPVEPNRGVVQVKAAEFEDIETAEGSPDLIKIPASEEGEAPTVILVNVRGLRSI